MIIVESFYESSGLAKSLKPVADMMKAANYSAFATRRELDIFISLLNKKFYECRKKVRLSKLSINISKGNNGCIFVFQNEYASSNSDIRLYVHNVNAILEYDFNAKGFFDISDRIEEKGGEL